MPVGIGLGLKRRLALSPSESCDRRAGRKGRRGDRDPEGYPCQWVKPREDSRGRLREQVRGAVVLATVQRERSTWEATETSWKALPLAAMDQLQIVSDAGL